MAKTKLVDQPSTNTHEPNPKLKEKGKLGRLVRFSVNPDLVDKSSDMRLSSSGWVELEEPIESLIDAIQSEGWAFSYVFRNGFRSAPNFICTDIVAVDIDGGWNLYKFIKDEFVQRNCTFIYTTPSHSRQEHRFRAVFVLPKTIQTASDLRSIASGLTRKMTGDLNTTDAARVWFGSQGCDVEWIGAVLSDDVFNDFLIDGHTQILSDVRTNNAPASCRSKLRLSPDMLVTCADGRLKRAGSIRSRQYIHCPYHRDTHPSAFIARNESGDQFIYCSSCSKTWWMRGGFDNDSRSMITDFSSFERMVLDIKSNGIDQERVPISGIFEAGNYRLLPKNIHILESQYISLKTLEPGITFIRSPKGSGKTTFLSEVVKDAIFSYRKMTLERFYSEFPDDDHPDNFFSGSSVLLIGHRQALIGDLCSKLELNCYLDDKGLSYGQVRARQLTYGICLDSLAKVQHTIHNDDYRYEIVVIDEVEQVLSHFLSETIGKKREELFILFAAILSRADRIVALDADLGWTSFLMISMLSRRTVRKVRFDEKVKRRRLTNITTYLPVNLYINRWKVLGRKIEMFPNETQITTAFLQDILRKKRIFVTSNSKKKVKAISEAIREFCKDNGIKRRILVVTSDNSRSTPIQSFIRNIKKEILKYDVVLTSPSLGTGLDIAFENNAQEIDSVYGLFESRVNSHFDIDQQISRVRNPSRVCAWISPEVFSFETDFDVVKEDFIQDQFGNTVYQFGESQLSPRKKGLTRFLLLGTLVTMQQRASKNLLRKNFVELKTYQGWEVECLQKDELAMAQGRMFRKLGRLLAKQKRIDEILRARTLEKSLFFDIEERFDNRGEDVTIEEFTSFQRTLIELFYGEKISEKLILKDDDWRMRRSIVRFEEFISFNNTSLNNSDDRDINAAVSRKIFQDSTIRNALLHYLFGLTPVFKNGQFDCSTEYTTPDLVHFGKKVRRLKGAIETHIGCKIGLDIETKPAFYLRLLLSTIGLTPKRNRVQVAGGQKIYVYSIDTNSLSFVQMVVARRATAGACGWDFVNREYGFTSPQGLESEILDNPLTSAGSP